ncbi:MAG: sigma-70 family RNA polymerase sigma factor [Deltaproteobacteria bacterium]
MITVARIPTSAPLAALADVQYRAPAWVLRDKIHSDPDLPIPSRDPGRRAETKPAPKTRRAKRAHRAALAQLEDLALLERVLTRDPIAFEVFVERFRNLMVACVSRVCVRSGVRLQDDDLADIVAETSLKMVAKDYRRLRLYRVDGGCSVSSWVGVISTSTAHDFLRKERRRRTDPMLDAELERVAPPVDGPDLDLVDREQRRFVDQALEKFSARDRRFVELYFVEAMAPDAIANEMGVSVSTVYSKKAKIKKRLESLARAA